MGQGCLLYTRNNGAYTSVWLYKQDCVKIQGSTQQTISFSEDKYPTRKRSNNCTRLAHHWERQQSGNRAGYLFDLCLTLHPTYYYLWPTSVLPLLISTSCTRITCLTILFPVRSKDFNQLFQWPIVKSLHSRNLCLSPISFLATFC